MKTDTKQEVSIKTKTLLMVSAALAVFGTAMFLATLIKGMESFSQKMATENVKFKNIR
ncbi:hypothetical protein HOB10_04520 [Candidatus Parcubacteria bacterium]|nr:hypothetical protein [Candidatus Parcubacteria bacterium]